MRKLLNTLYILNEDFYLACERENILIKQEGKVLKRLPIHILEGIVCFNYMGVSPGLIKLANNHGITITFLTPNGQMCGRFTGITSGNVILRRNQYRKADLEDERIKIASRVIIAKISNSRKILMRLKRDYKQNIDIIKVNESIDYMKKQIAIIPEINSLELLRGIEGDCARRYFQLFDEMIRSQKEDFQFVMRSKRPPLNRVNALLSYCYSILTYETQAALESVGLDSYVGFFHTDRPGRASLALDIIEEFRGYLVDRFVINLINLNKIKKEDFEIKENGAVLLSKKGKEKVISEWQIRKRKEIIHPFINEKIPIGLIPYVQSQLLSRYLRGDIESYPPFII